MRACLVLFAAAIAVPAVAQKPSSESTPPPEQLLAQIGAGVSDQELARSVAEAARHPLGSPDNPIRVGGPVGEQGYLSRLRCADGSEPSVGPREDGGVGAFGSVVGRYRLGCAAAPGKFDVLFDIYHDGHIERSAPPGLSLAAE